MKEEIVPKQEVEVIRDWRAKFDIVPVISGVDEPHQLRGVTRKQL